MTFRNWIHIGVIASVVCTLSLHETFSQSPAPRKPVQIIRDAWGIPHIYSEDEWSLFYGAGYAAGQDRLLQMALVRYSTQGRLSEFFGSRFLEQDKRLRTIGLYRHAHASLSSLNDTIRGFLEAYAAGVNAYMRDNPSHMAEIFRSLGGVPEPWHAADCIAAFHRIAEYFDRGWTGEVQRLRSFEILADSIGRDAAIRELEARSRIVDDSIVIVSRDEYDRYPKNMLRLEHPAMNKSSGGISSLPDDWEPPKMSHNWVVHGARSKTGLPILESDPQITVESPSTWYEFHLSGGRFNVRGIGMPGTPGLLIGFSNRCAWGLTALGSDCADLFQEELQPGSRSVYRWKGGWEAMTERSETIRVKGGQDVIMTIRESRHGPIVDEFVTGVKPGESFALHWMVTRENATSLEALIRMMLATDWPQFVKGMEYYVSPGVHLIYADSSNNIAYYTLARLPLRAHSAGIPFQGWSGDEEWLGLIPFREMPRMLNPIAGFISTANNAPVGSWYPYDIGGGIGDNARSWRLRELLEAEDYHGIEDFFEIHRDAIDPIVRDFVKFGLMAVDEEQPRDADVIAAATLLRGWNYRIITTSPTYPYTSIVGPTIKRSLRGTDLESRYLGSDAGLAQLFRDLEAYFDTTGELSPDAAVRAWLITQLGEVYRKSGLGGGGRPQSVTHKMPYQNNLERFGSLNSQHDLTSPPLHTGVVSTIWSQLGNSYSQIVDYATLDSCWSVLPPGISEVPQSTHFDDQISLWVDGRMHVAPLSRAAIDAIRESSFTLYPLTGIEPGIAGYPETFALSGNYPNPFRSGTTVPVDISLPGPVTLEVLDLHGRLVRILSRDTLEPGRHLIQWDGCNEAGTHVAAGLYILRVSDNQRVSTRAMTVLR